LELIAKVTTASLAWAAFNGVVASTNVQFKLRFNYILKKRQIADFKSFSKMYESLLDAFGELLFKNNLVDEEC